MSRKNWQIAFNKISRKHFDYVLCSKDKLEVVAVIELDDKSHNTKKSNNRDSFLENACKSASLTLVRFRAKSNYQIDNVRDQIELALNQN
jgi:very-short-patch-repair endonuclease